jgi:pantetheine-phosphate adenylyltransferase
MDDTTAIYPGSFDPITNGHLDILHRALEVFPRVVIAVSNEPSKNVLFPSEVRLQLVRRALEENGTSDVEVVSFDGLLVDLARELGAQALIRGLRAVTDFEYELQMALANRRLAPDLETVFLMAEARHCFLSSSLIKEVASYGGTIDPFVPRCVADALREAYRLDPEREARS